MHGIVVVVGDIVVLEHDMVMVVVVVVGFDRE